MYCHGDAGRFECLRIQFGTTHADQNPGTNVSPCIFAHFLYIRSVPQVTLHIRKLGLFQLQHECSHRYICWHCHILRGDKKKYRINTSIFIHGFSVHPSWRGKKPARLGKLPVLQGWRVSAQLGPEHPSSQGRHEAKDILISTLPPAALLMQALAGYLRRIE